MSRGLGDVYKRQGVNIPTGIPLYYRLDENFKPVVKGGEYLDPEAAKIAMAAVAAQGKK